MTAEVYVTFGGGVTSTLFWQYDHPTWANKFLTAWCMRSQIKPIKKFVRTVRRYQEMMNWFKAKRPTLQGL